MEHDTIPTHTKDFWLMQIKMHGRSNVEYSLEIAESQENYLECAVIKSAIDEYNKSL